MSDLKERYIKEIAPRLKEELSCRNFWQVPRVEKVVINLGFGNAIDKDQIQEVVGDLARLSGQKPVVTRARKSISNFKVREGMPVGAKVTLRRGRMYEFLERLIGAGLPRIRDFRGVSAGGFDGRGNYTLGLNDQSIFPEIDPNDVKVTQGMDITVVTSASDDDSARELLTMLGMPFSKN
ncbi:MAG: 50S ribosomal protein L5 [Verrucomicrobiota bacterium]